MNEQQNQITTHSSTLGKLFEALSKAQSKITTALKDKKNPFFKSSYADLSSVWEACRAPLSENGLAVIQIVEGSKQDMVLVTWLGHASGEWIKSYLPLMVMKQDPQSLGSSITYARRYALSAMVGVCPDDDDDGEKAMNRKENKIATDVMKSNITAEQADEIEQILDECDPKYKTWVLEFIKKTYKTDSVADLPSNVYERIKAAAVKNKYEMYEKKQDQKNGEEIE